MRLTKEGGAHRVLFELSVHAERHYAYALHHFSMAVQSRLKQGRLLDPHTIFPWRLSEEFTDLKSPSRVMSEEP